MKQWQVVWIVTMILVFKGSFFSCAQVQLKRKMTLMGSVFDITVVAKDSIQANKDIDLGVEEITRIENLISEWRPETQISQVNRNAGIQPVKVDREVFELTKRAVDYAVMTGGAFDISIAAMDNLWRYDGLMTAMPEPAAVQESVAKVGYKDIVLDSVHTTIYLARAGMKIGFGSIGKGYAADQCRARLQAMGVKGGIVNASGDLSAWGEQVSRKAWGIGINYPFKTGRFVKILKIRTGSVATSGSYEKFAEIDGKRYSHIINPKTGYPSTGLTSVTIIGPNAEFANALSTSVMVLGVEGGIKLLNSFPQYRYVFITDAARIIRSRL
jgi:thiamine biosynthesis lipoprotein